MKKDFKLFIVGMAIGLFLGMLIAYFLFILNIGGALESNGLVYNCSFWTNKLQCVGG